MSDYTRGQPDWSSSSARTFSGAGGSDLELGSRLWWPLAQVYDGEIQFWDDFETGVLHWEADADSADGEISLDVVRANSGNQSVKLVTPDVEGEQAWINRGLYMPFGGSVGVGLFASRYTAAGILQLLVQGGYNGQKSWYMLRYDWEDGTTQIRTPSGYETIATIPSLTPITGSFAWIQLAMDFENQVYKQAKIGSEVILLDQSGYNTGALDIPDWMQVIITYEADGNFARTMWIDDVIITRNVQIPTE